MAGCGDDDASGGPSSGGSTGAASVSGTGGLGGFGGTGGFAASAGTDAGRICSQGDSSVGSMLRATGFDEHEGRTVEAAFATQGQEPLTSIASVEDGRFIFDFLFPNPGCNLGAVSYAAGALYIDVDGDGTCGRHTDLVYVWSAAGGPFGTSQVEGLSPGSPHCSLLDTTDGQALRAARTICPDVTICLDFCGRIDGHFSAVCPEPLDSGVEDDAGPSEDAGL